MIGEVIDTGLNKYTVTKPISVDRENANIYLCTDQNGIEYIIKHFYMQAPMANIALSQYNHFGRRRDGSSTVFYEIQEKNKQYEFLLKHIERVRFNNKWLIILEYAQGITLAEYINKYYARDFKKVECAIIKLAETLTLWHNNGFAHGDPHLDNAMVHNAEGDNCKVMLIDYCFIHHKDFIYCQQYNCFEIDPGLRIREDLENNGKLGNGFRYGILEIQDKLDLGTALSDLFDLNYRHNSI
jgi:RIO-like serine/threonine protein kinase